MLYGTERVDILEQPALPFARVERIFASKNAVRHEAEPANQFERCSRTGLKNLLFTSPVQRKVAIP